jgi:lipopolysaccharide/colanic/teichoic acid biosynthesis glycosyltransferase
MEKINLIYENLPKSMKNEYTKQYVDLLNNSKFSLCVKRVFDVVVSFIILLLLSPFFLILAAAIKIDSKGPVFYRQIRVGSYNKDFKIFKFRTMVQDADKIGLPLTVGDDPRVTRVGHLIRKLRLDEFSQLLNVLNGTMSLVGPRPEVRKYVDAYTDEYMATLLIRPGITATSSIAFKDEDKILNSADNAEEVYVEKILPPKMKYNLEYMKNITLLNDIKIMFQTVGAVLK